MVYRLSLALDDNLCFEIEHNDLGSVFEDFEKLGGDVDWLRNVAKQAVAASMHGEPVRTVVRSLNGSVISDAPASQNATHASGTVTSIADAPSSRTAPPSDPWASEEEYPGEAAVAREAIVNGNDSGDPWGSGGGSVSNHPQTAQANASAGNPQTTTDKYGREWTTGLPDAPICECGIPAVRMKAKSQSKGTWYTKWKCSRGNTDDYRNKCSLDEFPKR